MFYFENRALIDTRPVASFRNLQVPFTTCWLLSSTMYTRATLLSLDFFSHEMDYLCLGHAVLVHIPLNGKHISRGGVTDVLTRTKSALFDSYRRYLHLFEIIKNSAIVNSVAVWADIAGRSPHKIVMLLQEKNLSGSKYPKLIHSMLKTQSLVTNIESMQWTFSQRINQVTP